MRVDTEKDTFKKFYDKVLAAKHLNDQEKILLSFVIQYNGTDKGFCFSNKEFSKLVNWDIRKIQRTIDSLKSKKEIMIRRNSLHSPDRFIFLYDKRQIELYEMGVFGKKMVLDYEK